MFSAALKLANVLNALSNANLWEYPCSTTDFMCMYSESRQTFFLKFSLSHKLQLLNLRHNFCSVMCYTVVIWTLIILTFGSNIATLLFNWPKPVHYVSTDIINASICSRIHRILKVKICIQRMQIFDKLHLITNLQCESKKVAPLKLFALLSLLVNLCNWKLPWLLPKHIPMSTPILVHLSEYLFQIYHFYRCDPSNFKNSI